PPSSGGTLPPVLPGPFCVTAQHLPLNDRQKPGKEYDLSLIFNIFPRQVILNPHMLPVSSISGATGKKIASYPFSG
ncbi:hypothetical protein, partial [Klebsiella pneumoniae]|uniref:hypothetical protein n=1 Tax=Klebsiella pneumoniae TaxID=573 RepID=UPI0030EB93C3